MLYFFQLHVLASGWVYVHCIYVLLICFLDTKIILKCTYTENCSQIKKTKSLHPWPLMKKVMLRQFLAATKKFYEWLSPYVRLSVRPSVCLSVTTFWLCSHHRIIKKFSGVITNDRSDVHTKGQGSRSKVKVTKVITQLRRFLTVTPVWIHIWWWNNA